MSVYEGKRLDMLTRYDRKGNECFLFWDSETTAARAMEYDSLGRLIKQTDAHCNVGCEEWTYEYRPGLKRTFELEFPNSDSTGFPREEAFSVILRKVQNAKALLALPEMIALHKLTPRLAKEEHFDTLGYLVKMVGYQSEGDTTRTEFQRDPRGRPLKEISVGSAGDTTTIEYYYTEGCKEAGHEHSTSSNYHEGWGMRVVQLQDIHRECDDHGNTVRLVAVNDYDWVDSSSWMEQPKVTVHRYSDENLLVATFDGSYDELVIQCSIEYDDRGNILRNTYYTGEVLSRTRTYTYNEHDKLVGEVVADPGSTQVLRYKYKYW